MAGKSIFLCEQKLLITLILARDIGIRKRFNRCHRGCQFSGGRSKGESRNPRKIGMGVPHILGLLNGGAKNWGCRFFCDTGWSGFGQPTFQRFQPDHSKSPSYASDTYQCMRLDVVFHENACIWYIAHRTQKNNPSVALQIISEISEISALRARAQIYL